MATMESIITDAKADLREQLEGAEYPEDLVFEIADSWVPIYYSQIAALAAEDISLMLDEPELGPACGDNFIGKEGTPIAWIAANIFERIEAALQEELQTLMQEKEEAEA
ncbi:hypothetical protein [Mariprofundus ferrooxydans]|uniref:hypothetical protein n=1 Tax=Mariprofundus ferrooxydans TaxID=314344 RepID=UPI0014312B5F|nr:hypothetical protein [Mariprofundus ferrooxydans]